MRRVPLFVLALLFFGCSEVQNVEISTQTNEVKVEFAQGFTIDKIGDDFQLNIYNPKDTSETQFSYKFSRQEKEGFIQIPLKNVISLSTTHLGMIDLLGELQSVKGISEVKYVCNAGLINNVQQGKCKEVFGLDKANFEDYLQIQPDAVVYSGFDNTVPILSKLKSAGLTPIANYEWRETHPLGRAEWIKFFGLLYDKIDLADSLFREEVKVYTSLCKSHNKNGPSLILGSIYADVWYAPAGESYTVQLIKDAGGNYVYANSKGTGSISLSAEEIFAENQETNIWIDPPGKSMDELVKMHKSYSLLGPFKSGKVFSYSENANCFWENAAAQPHLVLSDFNAIIESDSLANLNFYQQLK